MACKHEDYPCCGCDTPVSDELIFDTILCDEDFDPDDDIEYDENEARQTKNHRELQVAGPAEDSHLDDNQWPEEYDYGGSE